MSDKLLENLTAIDEKLDTVMTASKAAQDRQDALDKSIESLVGQDETVKKASADVVKAMADIQEMRQSITGMEKAAEFMEKSISRMGESGGGNTEELEGKAHQEFSMFLRKGTEISPEVVEAVSRSFIEKSFHGLSDEGLEREVKDLVAGVSPDGGYFIRPERAARMIERIFETSPVRSYATVETTASDVLEFLIDDDEAESGGWVGEVDTRGNTGTPQIGMLSIPVHEQFAQPRATQKMLDDAGFDIESWLSRKVTGRMTRTENSSFVGVYFGVAGDGDGAGKPRGFLNYEAWANAGVYERNKLEQIPTVTTTDTFNGDALKAMQNALIEEYQSAAIWALKRVSFEDIITLKDGQGRYIFQSRFIDDRDQMRLLGKQVVFMNDIPAVAANALPLVYGDFGEGYTVVDRLGFRVIRDIYTDKPYIKFYTTKRTGGAVTNFEALKIQKIAAS